MIYASLITAHCRSKILDAIATHPQGTKALVMVATDGAFFTSPHPSLPLPPSKVLGEWEESKLKGLCVFKQGAYWHDEDRERIAKGTDPLLKDRRQLE